MDFDKKNIIFGIVVLVTVVVFIIFGVSVIEKNMNVQDSAMKDQSSLVTSIRNNTTAKLSKFASEEEFKSYMDKASQMGVSGISAQWGAPMVARESLGRGGMEKNLSFDSAMGGEAQRFSQTNVQVKGIDEPDVLKTDGKRIYFAKENVYRWIEPMASAEKEIACAPGSDCVMPAPPAPQSATEIIKAFPAADLEKIGKIDKRGELLLRENMLIIFSESPQRKIYGFDVTDPEKPKEVWNIEQKENNYVVGARMSGSDLFVVNRVTLGSGACNVRPLVVNGKDFNLSCLDIFHPSAVVATDSAYVAVKINLKTGEIEDQISFTSSSSNSALYMSAENLYVTYQIEPEMVAFMTEFFEANRDLISEEAMQKIIKLRDYEISESSKMNELGQILEKYTTSLSADDRLKRENEMKNRSSDFFKKRGRELEQTGIVKIDVDNLEIKANGKVPGKLLNQFSLDEYEKNLRVATSVGGGFWAWGVGQNESVNDVYVLDENLEPQGKIIDLGQGERIYSARFIGDKGYVVTFKQIDPFYVLDLSDPKNPQKKGELKIPGFSSYLHPLEKDLIVGVGQENGQVKLSLFDVSDATDPKEISKYNLDEYWSEAQYNHHAFMHDADNKLVFIPGSKGGYIFSYANQELKLAKAVKFDQLKRAMYIDKYLYLVGESAVVVLDESNWEKVGEIEI